MRLENLTLDCYGPFPHQELALDAAPGRINLLVAPNGAGKSVLRAAFADLLFDLHPRSPMTFAFPPARLRLSARLLMLDGSRRLLLRRKGQGNTLSDGETPVPPELLRSLLGGADARLFADLFALDTAALREGGEQLCRSNGRLGQMLLAGSGGLGPVQRLLKEFAEARDEIGRADRKQVAKPLWRASADAEEARRRLGNAALRPDAWLALEKSAAEAETRLAELRAERQDVDAQLARRRAVQAARPWLARRDAADAVLAQGAGVPRLEPGFEARWRRALEEHTAAAAAAAEAARQEAALAAAPEDTPPDPALLDAAERIETALRQQVTALNAAADLPPEVEKLQAAAQDVARLRRELGWDASVPLPAAPAVRTARTLLAGRAGVLQAAEAARRERRLAEAARITAEQDLAALPEPQDAAGLAALVKEIRDAGDPARRREAAARMRRDAEAALQAALAALPARALTREQLTTTAAPAEATLAQGEAALAAADTGLREARRAAEAAAGEVARAGATLARLIAEADLPPPEALAEARAARDALWDAALSGGAAAALDYERALRQADAIADRLIAHAAQAASAEELRRRIAEAEAQHQDAQAACKKAESVLAAARQDFVAIAEAAGAPGELVPTALRGFLAARARALDCALAFDRTVAEERDTLAALDGATQRLGQAGVEGDGLAARLQTAEMRIEAARQAQVARKAAQDAWRKAARHAEQRAEAAVATERALAEWDATWRAAADALARPAEETPEATAAALELIEDLRRQSEALAAAERRAADMQAAIDRFAAEIAGLCTALAPDLAALPPHEAAARLRATLRSRQEQATRHAAHLKARAAARGAAAEAAAKAATAASALAALRSALGVADTEAAPARLEEVRRVTAAESELAEARRQLAGAALGEAELQALAAAEDAAAERGRIAALAARQDELGPLLEEAAAQARSTAEARDRAGAEDAATQAAAEREAALATLARHAEDALLLHAAASLLRAGLEAGRDDAGTAAVRRVGEVFAALTCGAFRGVKVEDDGSERVMVAQEADGLLVKRIEELSEGTRDQLFLALRIAALESYVRASPPLPFIADDVLQTFDDTRAEAALRALLDLSRHVQVLVLTHHPHVQALARRLPAGSVHTLVLPVLEAGA